MTNLKNISAVFVCSILCSLAALKVSAEQICQTEKIQPTAPTSRFESLGNGVVQDTQTGLQWAVCVEGLSGEQCEQGEAVKLNWAKALLHIADVNKRGFAGHKDWRLANIRELNTLVELQCASPSINSEVFPATPAGHVWTSSPYHFYTHYSWFVDFANGSYTYDERIQPKLVRLVRSAN